MIRKVITEVGGTPGMVLLHHPNARRDIVIQEHQHLEQDTSLTLSFDLSEAKDSKVIGGIDSDQEEMR